MSHMDSIDTCEAVVLGCLLRHSALSVSWASTQFNPLMFAPANRIIFDAIQKLYAADGTGGIEKVAGILRGDGTLEKAGGLTRLHELEMLSVPPILLPQYAQRCRDVLAQNRARETFKYLLAQLANPSTHVGDIVAQGMTECEAIANDRIEHSTPTMKRLAIDAVGGIQDRATGVSVGCSTGVPVLDRVTGGIRIGSQWVIAGPAKGGKSSLALTFLVSLAIEQGKRCGLFGLEMPSVENVERMLCHVGKVSATSCRDGTVNEHDMSRLAHAAERVAGAPIHCRDDLFDLVEIIAVTRQLKSAYPDLFAIFVDYAQLVGAAKDGENREREVATVSRSLRKLSMTLGISVILLSQTNDDGKLRESRSLGMDATKILTIEFGEGPHDRKIKLTQRDGISGVEIPVSYRGDFFQFADLGREPQESKPDPKKKRWRSEE